MLTTPALAVADSSPKGRPSPIFGKQLVAKVVYKEIPRI